MYVIYITGVKYTQNKLTVWYIFSQLFEVGFNFVFSFISGQRFARSFSYFQRPFVIIFLKRKQKKIREMTIQNGKVAKITKNS